VGVVLVDARSSCGVQLSFVSCANVLSDRVIPRSYERPLTSNGAAGGEEKGPRDAAGGLCVGGGHGAPRLGGQALDHRGYTMTLRLP